MKFAAFILIVALNWTGLSAVIQTSAYFNDTEASPGNFYNVATLDFSLNSSANFSPLVIPSTSSGRDISLINNGSLGFQYAVKIENATGTICDYLNLSADLDGVNKYSGSLIGFNYNAGEFSTSTDNWQFTAALTNNDAALQNQTCNFDFVFDGVQLGGAGFSDQEIIQNIITAGVWQKVVINKVYYDPDAEHTDCGCECTESNNEWVELYNTTSLSQNLAGWKICDNNTCDDLSGIIPAGGFAAITNKASTWNYWSIPSGVLKKTLNSKIGNGLSNDADMLILKNASSSIVDQMNWGNSTSTWANYNSNLWNPGIPTVAEGHMLARIPTGLDTDTITDWHDLELPQVSVVWPNGGEVLWVGHTETLQWNAINLNGPDSDLTIDLWYSKDSGNTWARIVTGTENDGAYDWYIPPCLDDGTGHCYPTPSHKARIKAVAFGPENFMVQDWDMSDEDFCPPIDYGLLTQEEKDMVADLLAQGLISSDEIINFEGVTAENSASTDTVGSSEENTSENPIIEDVSTSTIPIDEENMEQEEEEVLVNSTSTEIIIENDSTEGVINSSSTEETTATNTEIQQEDDLITEETATEETTEEDVVPEQNSVIEEPAIIPEDSGDIVENPISENNNENEISDDTSDNETDNSDTGDAGENSENNETE